MRDGWEAEAREWAAFAGPPGHDWAHDDINLPAPPPRPSGAGSGIPLSLHLRAVKP